MKIIVVEDERYFNDTFLNIVAGVLIEHNINIKVLSFYDYTENLKNVILNHEIKIYILDWELPSNDGLDIARFIRNVANDWKSIIIVVSAYDQKNDFISSTLSILVYISKLSNYQEELKKSIILSLQILSSEPTTELSNNTIVADEILYIEKEKSSKYCIITMPNAEIRIRSSLYSLKNKFKLEEIKRGLLINNRNIVLKNKYKIVFKNGKEINFLGAKSK